MKKLNVDIPDVLHKALEMYKLEKGQSKKSLVVELLMESDKLQKFLSEDDKKIIKK